MVFYPESAVERAMKVQEVILRAMAKRITWWQAAEIVGISDRQMRRWYQRYREFGYDGLYDRRLGRPSPKRVPLETVERVLELFREKYFDLNVRHFCEKLREEHGIGLSYSWVKKALQGAGLVKKGRQRGAHRRRRPRRPLAGMLLHLDGSRHRWFQDDRWYDLLVVLDDATTEIYYAQLVEEESTRTVMAALREVIERQGVFCALYSDRASHFFHTPRAGGTIDPNQPTQVGRALKELGIQMIPAYSPQARGRSERNFGTWQGRLPQELRLRRIATLEEANRFLREEYIDEFNRRFRVAPTLPGSGFVTCRRRDLDRIAAAVLLRLHGRDEIRRRFSFAVAILVASRSISRDLAFAIFVGTASLHGQLAQAFTTGLHAAFYESVGFMVLAAALSALRGGRRPRGDRCRRAGQHDHEWQGQAEDSDVHDRLPSMRATNIARSEFSDSRDRPVLT